jgi:hypothetical protein
LLTGLNVPDCGQKPKQEIFCSAEDGNAAPNNGRANFPNIMIFMGKILTFTAGGKTNLSFGEFILATADGAN